MTQTLSPNSKKPFPVAFFGNRRGLGFVALTLVIAVVVLFPLATLVLMALGGGAESLTHVIRYVLPRTLSTTAVLMMGVVVGTGVIGTISAWLVMTFRFPGRRFFLWALVLPLAIPSYLGAYAFVEFLSFTGPPQTLLRGIMGFESARDYWFPSVRNTGGAALILSLVFYPYVYLACVALLKLQGNRLVEASRALGKGPLGTLWGVLLPLLRPAIAAGVVLALMETLNDIGAVEFLGVETITFTIFRHVVNPPGRPRRGANDAGLAVAGVCAGSGRTVGAQSTERCTGR